MNTVQRMSVLLAVLALIPLARGQSATNEQAATNESPLSLAVDLADGSRIMGVPNIASIPMQTAYAKLDLALKNVRSITMEKDRELAVFEMTNGDRVKGAMILKTLELQTAVGKVSLGLEQIAKIGVISVITTRGLILDGLTGYWPLDNDAKDASGNGHDGTVRGAKPVPGVRGGAFFFDGSATIDLGNLDFPGGAYTVSGWIRTDEPARAEDWRSWIDKLDGSGGPTTGGPIMVGLGDGRGECGAQGAQYMVWDGWSGVVNLLTPAEGPNLRDKRWHMCTVTFAKGCQKLYLDGVVVATGMYSGALPSNSTLLALGGHNFGPYHHPWIGDVDEVFVYQRALSEAEVESLFRR